MTDRLPVHAHTLPAVTAAEMADVDKLALARGLELLQMMENAGSLLARLVCHRFPSASRILVLAGPGGNGGGAMVAARRLAGFGYQVVVIPTTGMAQLTPVTAHQARLLERIGAVSWWPDRHPESGLPETLTKGDVIIDGILGYSVRGAPHGAAAQWIQAANRHPAPKVALDAPSGLNPDDGTTAGEAIRAHTSLTLALPKQGLLSESARPWIGDLAVGDIGIPPAWVADAVPRIRPANWYEPGDLAWLALR